MDIGAQLRASREALGLSLDTLAQRTRVQPRILEAIERNDLGSLPPKPYGRGFVRAYAQEVGRNPDETVRQYFGQFAPAAVEPAAPSAAPAGGSLLQSPAWAWLGGTGLAVLVLVVWSAGLGSAPDAGEDGAVGTAGAAEAAVARAEEPRANRSRETAPEPRQDVTVLLTATRDCWVTATADGERAIFRLLREGDRETLRGEREVVIRAGDAGALSLVVNGRDVGSFGSAGQVRTLQITPANASSVR